MTENWRTRRRSPGSCSRTDVDRRRRGRGRRTPCPAARPPGSSGPATPVSGQADVGAEHPPGAGRPWPRRAVGRHHRAARARRARRTSPRTRRTRSTRGTRRDAPGTSVMRERDQPAGERLGQAEASAPAPRSSASTTLSMVSSSTPKTRSGPRTARTSASSAASRASAASVGGGLGREADLEALDARGQEGDGDRRGSPPRRPVEDGDAAGEPLGQAGLALAPGPQRAAADHGGDRPARRWRSGRIASVDDLLHLVGHAGHGVDDLLDRAAVGTGPGDRADQARRGARLGVGDGRGAHGHLGLAQVVHRHARGPAPPNMASMRAATSSSRSRSTPMTRAMASRVMSSWVGPSPPHTITASARSTRLVDDRHHPVEVVADLGLAERVDAGQRQLLADPGGVGVDDLPEQQLGPDGDHLAAHRGTVPARRLWEAPVTRPPAGRLRSGRRGSPARVGGRTPSPSRRPGSVDAARHRSTRGRSRCLRGSWPATDRWRTAGVVEVRAAAAPSPARRPPGSSRRAAPPVPAAPPRGPAPPRSGPTGGYPDHAPATRSPRRASRGGR